MKTREEIESRILQLNQDRQDAKDDDDDLVAEFIAFEIQGLKWVLNNQ